MIAGSTIYKTNIELHSLRRTIQTITLGVTGDSVCDRVQSGIRSATGANQNFSVGIRKAASTTNDHGVVFVGGQTLEFGEGAPWEVAGSNELAAKPSIIVTWSNTSGGSWSEQFMRYTASDPTSNQSTPSNSIGGFVAPNRVFIRTQISDEISSTQTTIPVLGSPGIPETSGLFQVGPEIMRYGNKGSNQLLNVSRGVVPSAVGYPATIYPVKEFGHFLEVDNLFDRSPTTGFSQYRCVAILYDDNTIAISNVKVILIQDPDANAQIDIGIEVPEFDSHDGTATSAITTTFTVNNEGASPEIFNLHLSKGALPDGSDLFEGGFVTFDEGGSNETMAQITSFDRSGTITTFILDRNVNLAAGTTFRINPGPAQIIINEVTPPTSNSSRFFGFLGDGGSAEIGKNNIRERNSTMINSDVFYLWIKRTLTANISSQATTGGVIMVQFDDSERN